MKRFLAVVCAVCVCLFLLTASIGLPIYVRPFYYAHIVPYDLEQVSGYSEAEIRRAYDEVLDYLTIPGRTFGTGIVPHSAEGKAHFEDCKGLFDLNASILLGSALVLAVLAVTAPMIIGVLAAMDFDRAFVVFHSLFFPGKTNWVFDWYQDPIIRVLPQAFFRNCAILIGGGLVTMAGGILIWVGRKR